MVIDGAWYVGKNAYRAGRFLKKTINKVKDKKKRSLSRIQNNRIRVDIDN